MRSVFETVQTLPEPTRLPAAAWIELLSIRHLLWSPYTLPIRNLPPRLAGLRIVHLTDMHLTAQWMPALDQLHARLAADPPDLILATGDFVEHKENAVPAIPNVRRFVAGLKSRLGVYATLGNHDGDTLPVYVPDLPVRLLCNETFTLRDGDTAVDIIGLHGVAPCDASPRVLAAIPPRPPNTLRLVMAHYPHQVTLLGPVVVDVVFAGHTHGGQVCLPGGRAILSHDGLPKRFAKGVHDFDGRWLVVPRGLGFSTLRVRAFCPAEAIEVTLVPA